MEKHIALETKKYSSTEIIQQFDKIRVRGPDCSKCSFNYNVLIHEMI